MEQKYNSSTLNAELMRLKEFCKQEGEVVTYLKDEKFECEETPAQWFAYVERGCFKYVTRGISDNKKHITWFSFEGEFVADYPRFYTDILRNQLFKQ
jgi:hypothetical protein